jgi:hypothetical protein
MVCLGKPRSIKAWRCFGVRVISMIGKTITEINSLSIYYPLDNIFPLGLGFIPR